MAATARNSEILTTMVELGLIPASVAQGIDTTGRQSTAFRSRIIGALRDQRNITDKEAAPLWDQAMKVATWQPDPNVDPDVNFENLLKARGVPQEAINKIQERATQLAGQPGVREIKPATGGGGLTDLLFSKEGGAAVSGVNEFVQAAQEVLGPQNAQFLGATRQAGIEAPPAPAVPPPGAAQAAFGGQGATSGWAAPPAPGSRDAVMQIQRDLNAKGANLKVDGIMGPATQAAQTRFGGAPGGGGPPPPGGGAAGAGLPPGASDAQVEQYLRSNYGFAMWAWNIPELRGVLTSIAKNPSGFTPDAVKGLLMNTQWWQANGQNVADYLQKQQEMGTAGFARYVGKTKDDITAYAHQYGISLAPDRLDQIANDSLKFGWDDQTLHDAISNEFHYQPGGQDSAFVSSLKQDAKSKWLVPVSDQALQQWGHDIASGRMTQEDFDNYMRTQAKSMWPGVSGYLDQGGDMGTFVSPYKSVIGKELSVNPDTIDFTDPKYIGILNQVDPKTGNKQVMSLDESRAWARQQPEWAQTAGAHQVVANLTEKLAQDLGRV